MASYERPVSSSCEWYTPAWVFDALNVEFDLDPCSSGNDHVPASSRYSKQDNGLVQEWFGRVWMNPPFGRRNNVLSWVNRMRDHGNGIALLPNRTDTEWWQVAAINASAALFHQGRIKFVRPDGTEGSQPGFGTVFFAYGDDMAEALVDSNLVGFFFKK